MFLKVVALGFCGQFLELVFVRASIVVRIRSVCRLVPVVDRVLVGPIEANSALVKLLSAREPVINRLGIVFLLHRVSPQKKKGPPERASCLKVLEDEKRVEILCKPRLELSFYALVTGVGHEELELDFDLVGTP